LIVIDNGSSDDTLELLRSLKSELPLKVLVEPIPGKSRALNRALEVCNGELIAFTDDDVIVSPSWGSELVRAAAEYRRDSVFCGPIVPAFPSGTPRWLVEHPFASAAFAKFGPDLPEGPLAAPGIPFGPNFAVRNQQLRNMTFRLDLGPSVRGPFMCEDTEFVGRLRKRGNSFVYLPKASVTHLIREELTTQPYLFLRSYYLGRSYVRASRSALTIPFLVKADTPESLRFEIGCLLNLYYGEVGGLLEAGNEAGAKTVLGLIEDLPKTGDVGLLVPPVIEMLRTHEFFARHADATAILDSADSELCSVQGR
jgi:glycosyltransferase involved in cell wall biosynthesis